MPPFCKSCHFDLRAQPIPRCPECNRAFDPADPRSFHAHPPQRRRRRKIAVLLIALAIPAVLLATAFASVYNAWQSEQDALAHLKAFSLAQPVGGYDLQKYLGPCGAILDRVTYLSFSPDDVTNRQTPYIARLTHLEELNLGCQNIDDAALPPLSAMTNLTSLDLCGTKITSAGLAHLTTLTRLTSLNLTHTATTDAALPSITAFRHLQSLDLTHTKISTAGLTRLALLKDLNTLSLATCSITDISPLAACSRLQHLDLSETAVSDLTALESLPHLQTLNLTRSFATAPALAHLARLSDLSELTLSEVYLTDKDAPALAGLHSLKKLDLSKNYLTDAALPYLASLQNLEELDLRDTFITVRAIPYFKKLPHLQKLSVIQTEMDPAAIRQLKAVLPSVTIEADDPSGPPQKNLSWRSLIQQTYSATAPTPRELAILTGPPVTPHCKLDPLEDTNRLRWYLSCDLNDDGIPEYFVESCTGANTVGFALSDHRGNLLTSPRDVGDIGDHTILILTTKHHGYHDIINSYTDPGGVTGHLWQFNGKRYTATQSFEFESEDRTKAFIEEIPGTTIAAWHNGFLGRPR